MMSSAGLHLALLLFYLSSVMCGSSVDRVGGQCLTVGGAQTGVPCVFPFKARGTTFTECTKSGGFETPWCSTKVDANGDTVLGNWGDCPTDDPDCYPAATTAAAQAETTAQAGGDCLTTGGAQVGVPCVFPFKARGNTYTSCTFAGGFSTPWCSTKVDANGDTVLGNWGDCPMDDPTCPNDATTVAADTSAAAAETTAAAAETTAAAAETTAAAAKTTAAAAETTAAEAETTAAAAETTAAAAETTAAVAETTAAAAETTAAAAETTAAVAETTAAAAETTAAAAETTAAAAETTAAAAETTAAAAETTAAVAETTAAAAETTAAVAETTAAAAETTAVVAETTAAAAETTAAAAETTAAAAETTAAAAETTAAVAETTAAVAETTAAAAETTAAAAETTAAAAETTAAAAETTAAAETSVDATTIAPCMTVSGAQTGVACVFPFKSRGQTYTTCTVAGGYSTPWCSTKVDDAGVTVLGNWGECALDDPNCPNDITTEAPTTESTTAEVPPDGGAPVRRLNLF